MECDVTLQNVRVRTYYVAEMLRIWRLLQKGWGDRRYKREIGKGFNSLV